jgi:hypothetical protein
VLEPDGLVVILNGAIVLALSTVGIATDTEHSPPTLSGQTPVQCNGRKLAGRCLIDGRIRRGVQTGERCQGTRCDIARNSVRILRID